MKGKLQYALLAAFAVFVFACSSGDRNRQPPPPDPRPGPPSTSGHLRIAAVLYEASTRDPRIQSNQPWHNGTQGPGGVHAAHGRGGNLQNTNIHSPTGTRCQGRNGYLQFVSLAVEDPLFRTTTSGVRIIQTSRMIPVSGLSEDPNILQGMSFTTDGSTLLVSLPECDDRNVLAVYVGDRGEIYNVDYLTLSAGAKPGLIETDKTVDGQRSYVAIRGGLTEIEYTLHPVYPVLIPQIGRNRIPFSNNDRGYPGRGDRGVLSMEIMPSGDHVAVGFLNKRTDVCTIPHLERRVSQTPGRSLAEVGQGRGCLAGLDPHIWARLEDFGLDYWDEPWGEQPHIRQLRNRVYPRSNSLLVTPWRMIANSDLWVILDPQLGAQLVGAPPEAGVNNDFATELGEARLTRVGAVGGCGPASRSSGSFTDVDIGPDNSVWLAQGPNICRLDIDTRGNGGDVWDTVSANGNIVAFDISKDTVDEDAVVIGATRTGLFAFKATGGLNLAVETSAAPLAPFGPLTSIPARGQRNFNIRNNGQAIPRGALDVREVKIRPLSPQHYNREELIAPADTQTASR